MGIDDYWVHCGQPYGRTHEESDNAFREKSNSGLFESEGTGAQQKLWLPKLKERNRNRTVFVENKAEESSGR